MFRLSFDYLAADVGLYLNRAAIHTCAATTALLRAARRSEIYKTGDSAIENEGSSLEN